MELVIEDLGLDGIWLIGPNSRYFDQWLGEILDRTGDAPAHVDAAERPAAAILVNGSGKDIAAWTLIWRFEKTNGTSSHRTHSHGIAICPSLLLPFGLQESDLRTIHHRMTIMAGSKRYVGGGRVVGDNRDVQMDGTPGLPHERDRGRRHPVDWREVRRATLSLDGVFFTDGEFLGPDEAGSWSRVTSEAAVHAETARMACDGIARGEPANVILDAICAAVADEPADQPKAGLRIGLRNKFRYTRQDEARMVETYRRHTGDEETLARLAKWQGVALPEFRRRAAAGPPARVM